MTPLEHMARRVESDPFFLGHRVARHRDAHGLADAGLCERLGCTPAGLVALKLCRATGSPADLDAVALEVGCDAGRLRAVVGIADG